MSSSINARLNELLESAFPETKTRNLKKERMTIPINSLYKTNQDTRIFNYPVIEKNYYISSTPKKYKSELEFLTQKITLHSASSSRNSSKIKKEINNLNDKFKTDIINNTMKYSNNYTSEYYYTVKNKKIDRGIKNKPVLNLDKDNLNFTAENIIGKYLHERCNTCGNNDLDNNNNNIKLYNKINNIYISNKTFKINKDNISSKNNKNNKQRDKNISNQNTLDEINKKKNNKEVDNYIKDLSNWRYKQKRDWNKI